MDNLFQINDIQYTKQPDFPYPNPLVSKNLKEFYSNDLYQKTFEFAKEKIINSSVFKNLEIKLENPHISRFFIRDWKTNFDLLFETFFRIDTTDQFLFMEIHLNTNDNKYENTNFNPKIYKILCFKLELIAHPDKEIEGAEMVLKIVDKEKWADWKIKKIEKTFELFNYSLFDPKQVSVVLLIYKEFNVKRVIIAYSYEEEYDIPYPACIYIM